MMIRCLGCMTEYEQGPISCPYCGYKANMQSESPLHMQPGTMLLDRYLVGKVIGYGGFGVTYIGWDNILQQRVAIKEYLPSEFATRSMGQADVTVFGGNKAQQFADGMAKFVDEAKRLAQFQQEDGIVRVYNSFEANNTAYIIMEYLDGETLTAYLDREGKVPVEKAVEMLTPVIRSLETVHKAGIIHRDIAPDNIMLTKDGQVKLIDFGAARYATTSHSRSLTVIIKPGYSPEEQYRSRGDQGPHTDVYALGAVLYRMITGVTPPDALERRAFFENKKKDILLPPSKNCKIKKSQENAILNAMNVRIEDRTPSAEAFLTQLTSEAPVQRVLGKIKRIDLMKWPLWAKIIVPAGGIAAAALLALVLTGKIGFANNLITTLTLGENMTRVPSVINYSVGVAQETLDGQELVSIIGGRETSDVIPANMVLRQSVSAGEIVERNSSVELFISAAAEPVIEDGKMPDVAYYTEAEAVDMLRQLGAVVTVEQEYSSDIAEGLVIRGSVGMGEPLAEGAEVILYVSMGPDPAAVVDVSGESNNSSDPNNPAAPQNPAVTLNRSTLSLFVGDSVSLTASGGNGSFSWSSSNSSVVTVNGGSVSAVGKGSATITVSSDGKTASCPVTVQDYMMFIGDVIEPQFVGTPFGEPTALPFFILSTDGRTGLQFRQLAAFGIPDNAIITWTSSNPNIADVQNGMVRSVSPGNATIKASTTIDGKAYSAATSVTVEPPYINVKSFSIPETMQITSGAYQCIGWFYTFNGQDTSQPDEAVIRYTCADETVATIDSNGWVTGIRPGVTTITAEYICYNYTYFTSVCTVTVE